jgi:hypothetical protein
MQHAARSTQHAAYLERVVLRQVEHAHASALHDVA